MTKRRWNKLGTRAATAVVLGAALVLPACGLATPRWTSPGTIMDQRFRAIMYDPYTDVDIAPEVVGGRPREFQRPLPQADRNDLVSQQISPYLPTPR